MRLRAPRSFSWLNLSLFTILLACNGCGHTGGNSGSNGGESSAPAPPTNLTAAAGNQQASLSWTASGGATSYKVKRGTASGGPYTMVGSPAGTTYADTSLTNGTAYYYVVTAVNATGESANSNQASATPSTTPSSPRAPSAPANLTATGGNQQVSLAWMASTGATSYNVKRAPTNGGPYTTVASPAGTSYTDTAVANGTTYYYVVTAVSANGESANSNQASATPSTTPSSPAAPSAPANLTATAGNQQVSLFWRASSAATSYNVKRSTASGGPYTTVGTLSGTSYMDTGLTNGTTYYYVVTAVNPAGQSANSNQASATPSGSTTNVNVTVNVLANRHTISPYVYGGNFPQNAAAITDSGLPLVRWGGNAASTYNWQLGTDNADNDYYFEDYVFGALNNPADAYSTQFIKDVKAAGSVPLMTMVMLPWVAQSAETSTTQGGSDNYHWVFSVSLDGACGSNVDYYNKDAGINLKSDCQTPMVASQSQIERAYYPLLDDHTQSCPSGNCVYRDDWSAALATAFAGGSCPIPYSSIVSCHFYDMDNEIDIWGGTHVDVHPNPSGYDELANTYVNEASKLKTWDPQAVRLGPVLCCWWDYWNGANGADKDNHGGDDFLPWWLNQVHWEDEVAGTRSLDIFDIHAYPDGPDMSSYTQAQKQAAAVSIYRDYWDPALVSPSGTINQPWTTQIQPSRTIAFRIPRLRAIANTIYPGTPLSFTEWSAAFAGESDFSTALGDADAYAILGRERVSLATRWVAPVVANPNYLALKLYTNYDGAHHGFAPVSVAAGNTANPNLFSSYAAASEDGKTLTLMVINKDPQNSTQVQFALNGFNPTSMTAYTLAANAPQAISAAPSSAWAPTQAFAPYSITLLVVSGSSATLPSSGWDLNPDTIMVPAGGNATLQPVLTSGSSNVNLSSAVFDSYEGAAACNGTITVTNGEVTGTQPGTLTVQAGSAPGFCHFTVTGSDGSATQTQGGWIIVGNPPATLASSGGNNQSGSAGSALPQALTVALSPGQSGGTANGASILFTAGAGTLSNGTSSGSKVIVVTNSSGVASVTLTLPGNAGQVHVQAEAPYGLGHPVTTFTETAQ
jgi:fibronectin type 3 domain-containing protein